MKSELYEALAQRLQDAGLSETACAAVDMIDAAYVIRAMQSRIEALEKDAARYRWLRTALADKDKGVSHHFCSVWFSEELDAAIDTAMQSEKGGV